MRIRVLAALVIASLATCVYAQQPVILSFEHGGTLTWSNAYLNAVASIERLTDVPMTDSVVTVTETLGVTDGSTAVYNYTVEHPPIVNPSVTISDGTYSWNDETGSSTNPPVLTGAVNYPGGIVFANYSSQVPAAGTPIEVEYSYLPVSTAQQWLRVHSYQTTSEVSETTVGMGERTGLFRVENSPGPMVLIPGGSNSGTNPLASGDPYDSCLYPATYSLSVGSFYMGRFEVTNDEMVDVMQWAYDHSPPLITVSASTVQNALGDPQELLDLNDGDCRITWDGSHFGMKAAKGSGYPCVEVTWYGAAAYCNYRSEMEGRPACYDLSDWSCDLDAGGYRLPTSEEWEYAGRGGLSGQRFPWGSTIDHSRANYRANGSAYSYDVSPYTSPTYHPDYDQGGYPYTSPVGSFAANAWGLYDMVGNVWEWCSDWDPCYVGSYRVLRGCCWNDSAISCHVGLRISSPPGRSYDTNGFRAVLPPG